MTTARVLVEQQWLDDQFLTGTTVGEAAKATAAQAHLGLDTLDVAWAFKTDSGQVLHPNDPVPTDCDQFELVDVTDYEWDADEPQPPTSEFELPRDGSDDSDDD